jgi:cytochrome c biogenesis factor
MGPWEDLYLILAGIDNEGKSASMKVFVNPLQVWLWYGAMIMIVGSVVVALPVARRARDKGVANNEVLVNA